MPEQDFRLEHDSMGAVAVPAEALWGAQTQRALENVRLSSRAMPGAFIRSLALIKWAAARANSRLAGLDPAKAAAIEAAALEVAAGAHAAAFPLDVFQTGSGTSSNMNVNEVIARLAARALGAPVHPNDDVNRSQSSNDCVPSAIHISAALAVRGSVCPALAHLSATLGARLPALAAIVKTGRTHLMDAMPLTVGQEWSGWRAQVDDAIARFEATLPRVLRLAQGGTAVGTGVNAPPGFGAAVAAALAERTGLAFTPHPNFFAALASQDTAVELSGQARAAALALGKIANDVRWMNSGPLAGLAELAVPALQPGSSIMPGKVNPVVAEAVGMAVAQVIGNDAAVANAAQLGAFQLNMGLPVIAANLLESLELIAAAARALADQVLAGAVVHEEHLLAALARNPILVTALNPLIGYEAGARIAKEAYASGEPILEVAVRLTGLPREQLAELLDPARLTGAGGGR
jgi:fumarate hydratase class II